MLYSIYGDCNNLTVETIKGTRFNPETIPDSCKSLPLKSGIIF